MERNTTWMMAAALGLAVVPGCAMSEVAVGDEAISGGTTTTCYPSVGFLLGRDGTPTCSGTLIAPDLVLTAAHCVDIGWADSFGTGTVGEGRPSRITEVYVNPRYCGERNNRMLPRDGTDIAVVRLARPITGITPAQLGSAAEGNSAYAVGYGNTGNDGHPTSTRRSARFDITDVLDDGTIYAQPTSGTGGICSGDSGGPLVSGTSRCDASARNPTTIFGVASTGPSDCENGGSSTWTSVAAATDARAFVDDVLAGRATPTPAMDGAPLCCDADNAGRPEYCFYAVGLESPVPAACHDHPDTCRCRPGRGVCSANGVIENCSDGVGIPTAEVCGNAEDDDCDMAVDEGCDPCAGSDDPCCGSSDPCCGSSDPSCGTCDDVDCSIECNIPCCGGCETSADCGWGQVCDACACQPDQCTCGTSLDCPEGFDCNGCTCELTDVRICTCETSADCAAGFDCNGCTCEGTDVTILDPCGSSFDCGANQVCRNGFCRSGDELGGP